MDDRDALSREMHATLDIDTSDMLLDDPSSPLVDRELAGLAELLGAVRAPATAAELLGETVALQRFRAATTARPVLRSRRRRLVVAAAAFTASLGVGTGLAAAGVLPGPVQDFASSALDSVGVHVPDSNGNQPDGVPPTSTPPHETPPVSTPVGPPITPPGQDPNFNPGQSGEDHGVDATAGGGQPEAPPGNTTQTTGKPEDKPTPTTGVHGAQNEAPESTETDG
jgi:hypothetical protein